MTADELAEARRQLARRGIPEDTLDDDRVKDVIKATVILDGVLAGRWRILVGDDAHLLDEFVRADPEAAYRPGALDLPALLRPETAGER